MARVLAPNGMFSSRIVFLMNEWPTSKTTGCRGRGDRLRTLRCDEIVEDLRAGIVGAACRRRPAVNDVAADQFAVSSTRHPVGVARRPAEVATCFHDGALQVDHVLRLDRVAGWFGNVPSSRSRAAHLDGSPAKIARTVAPAIPLPASIAILNGLIVATRSTKTRGSGWRSRRGFSRRRIVPLRRRGREIGASACRGLASRFDRDRDRSSRQNLKPLLLRGVVRGRDHDAAVEAEAVDREIDRVGRDHGRTCVTSAPPSSRRRARGPAMKSRPKGPYPGRCRYSYGPRTSTNARPIRYRVSR